MPRFRLVFALLLFPIAALTAQPGSVRERLKPNSQDRLRVTLFSDAEFTGSLIRFHGDSLWIADDGREGELAFDLHRVRRLESFAGRRLIGWAGLGYGILAGTGLGAAIAAASYSPCVPSRNSLTSCMFAAGSRGDAAGLGAVLGFGVGLNIGGIVALMKMDRWKDISTSELPRVTVRPTAQGISLSASLRF